MIPLRVVSCVGTNTDADADADANPANVADAVADAVADTFADTSADTVEAAEFVLVEGIMRSPCALVTGQPIVDYQDTSEPFSTNRSENLLWAASQIRV